MSKTTIALIIILLMALGGFLYTDYDMPQNAMMTSLTNSPITQSTNTKTTLSLTSAITSVYPGQTISLTVLIDNQDEKPTLAQLELAYDPSVVTAISILPGTYFTRPTIPLQNIRLDSGRISYALRCPVQPNTRTAIDCANAGTTHLATVTFLVNGYTTKPQTTISFLPKTLVRSKNGTDILGQTNSLTIKIQRALVPMHVATPSGKLK